MFDRLKRIFQGETQTKKIDKFIQLLKDNHVQCLSVEMIWESKEGILRNRDTFSHGAIFTAYAENGKPISYRPQYFKETVSIHDISLGLFEKMASRHFLYAQRDADLIRQECRFIRITFYDEDGMPIENRTIETFKLNAKKDKIKI